MTDPSNELRRAVQMAQAGDLAAARRHGEAAIAAAPDYVDALRLTGIVCCQAGDLDAGVRYLKGALDRDPRDGVSRLNLAKATMSLGDWAAAERLCREVPTDDANADELVRLLGYILQVQQRLDEAIPVFEKVVASDPDDFETWNNLGNARRQTGDLDGAIVALETARGVRDDFAIIHLNLAGAFVEAHRLDDALAALRAAVTVEPDNITALAELARVFSALDRYRAAQSVLVRLLEIDPGNVDARVELGDLEAQLDDRGAAEAHYREVLATHPGHVPAWLSLGLLLEGSNRHDDLRTLLAEAGAAQVPETETGLLRALLLKRDGAFATALEAATDARAPAAVSRKFHLIGELADRLEQPERAFAAFTEMNRLIAAHPVEPRRAAARYREGFAAATQLLTPEWVAGWQPAPPIDEPPAPIFLVGFPRSGTTLLDTILMGHPALHVLEEVPIMQRIADALGDPAGLATATPERLAELRAMYFAEVGPIAGGRTIVDKLPFNIVHAALIHRLFPDARFIFALRHPADVVLSCYIQNFRINNATANFLDLDDAAALYDLALTHWHRARDALPLRVHDFRYEAMIADTEGELRALLDYLGLDWDDRLLDHQRTAAERSYIGSPSYAQVTQPIYARAAGRWQRYRDQLGGVLPRLAPWIERLGY